LNNNWQLIRKKSAPANKEIKSLKNLPVNAKFKSKSVLQKRSNVSSEKMIDPANLMLSEPNANVKKPCKKKSKIVLPRSKRLNFGISTKKNRH